MKKRILITSTIAAAAVIGTGLGIRAFADRRDRGVTLRAELRGLNEVPPTTSRAAALRASP